MSVKDLEIAKDFYTQKVGLKIAQDMSPNALMLDCGANTRCMLYPKDDHQPATHTVLNLDVDSIEEAVSELRQNGIKFNQEEGTDDDGIATLGPAKAAWFNDPDGNFISLTQNI